MGKNKRKKFLGFPEFWDLLMIIKYDLIITNRVKKFISKHSVSALLLIFCHKQLSFPCVGYNIAKFSLEIFGL